MTALLRSRAPEDVDDAFAFLRDLHAGRLRHCPAVAVVRFSMTGSTTGDLRRTGASTATITRIASFTTARWLPGDARPPEGRVGRRRGSALMRDRLRLAVLNKGRLRADAGPPPRRGPVFGARPQPGARVQNFDSTSCSSGRTTSSVRRRRCADPVMASISGGARPGFAHATSAMAAAGSSPRSRRTRRPVRNSLAGVRAATAAQHHPALLRRAQHRSSHPDLGAVEVAPRLGLAEAIVDLVSTGFHPADERISPDLEVSPRRRSSSPAAAGRLARGPGRDRHDALGGRRPWPEYLMMNAPARVERADRPLPGLESPSAR